MLKNVIRLAMVAAAVLVSGCSTAYKGVVRPTPEMGALSPDLEGLTDAKIDMYLKNNVRAAFPSVLAVARVPGMNNGYSRSEDSSRLETIAGDEAKGWEELTQSAGRTQPLISQIHFITPMLLNGRATLKPLRDAAALLHAPLLLVYMEADESSEGANGAAMAYWTIVGLFIVPGNTVGHMTVCQGVLVDTRSGVILATVQGESKHEENVLPGAVDIASDRVKAQATAEAIRNLQVRISETLKALAEIPQSDRVP